MSKIHSPCQHFIAVGYKQSVTNEKKKNTDLLETSIYCGTPPLTTAEILCISVKPLTVSADGKISYEFIIFTLEL